MKAIEKVKTVVSEIAKDKKKRSAALIVAGSIVAVGAAVVLFIFKGLKKKEVKQ